MNDGSAISNGIKLGHLVLESDTWIHRKVERLEIVATGECVHRVSVDFTLPQRWALKGSKGAALVPVGAMRKGPLRAFTARGPSDKAVPILETGANGEHSVAMLVALAENASPAADKLEAFRAVATEAVFHAGTPDAALMRRIEATVRELEPDPRHAEHLTQLVQQMQTTFLMIVEIDENIVGRRAIVKFEYREPTREDLFKESAPEIEWVFVDFGLAASTHYEFSPPPLLLVADAELAQTAVYGGGASPIARETGDVATTHFVGRPVHRFATATLRVRLIPRRYGAYSAMYFSAWTVAVVILGGVAIRAARDHHLLPQSPLGASLPPMVLAAGGLLLTWIARAPEDWITARNLWKARRVLLLLAALLVLTAGYLAVPLGEPWRTVGWVTLAGLALALAIYTTYRRMSDDRCTLGPRASER
ncbi:hypothetical protein [Tsukamurella pseudospumae]|uniref:Uncharacterized protein n=1 Tax=Tsukamurella pseudospumae TaxID=239498 RepID=A0A138AEE2_9ACTN|nr:hypothetical protein [Tsukamurella pseudospumae]KXP08833.1 hypothetical protein AXK60_09225 [Tsukamurella pseudospumae]